MNPLLPWMRFFNLQQWILNIKLTQIVKFRINIMRCNWTLIFTSTYTRSYARTFKIKDNNNVMTRY
jgi:hypothetical protein